MTESLIVIGLVIATVLSFLVDTSAWMRHRRNLAALKRDAEYEALRHAYELAARRREEEQP